MASGAVAQPAAMGEFSRLSGIFFEPKAAFRDIAARPRWWPPLALIIALSLVFSYTFTQRVGWERFMRQQFESNPRTQNMPADQREGMIATQARYAPIFAYGFAVVGMPVMAAIVAGVFLFLFRTVLGAELSFRQVFAIYSYSLVPLIISTIMSLAVMLLKDPDQFD